jgi:hypothetical protein
VKAPDFDTMKNDEGAKNKEHANDHISESEMNMRSKKIAQRSYNLLLR